MIAPDCLFPSSNDLGIPDLLQSLQADYVDQPFLAWGSQARGKAHKGTIHFYVDDYRFNGLWERPDAIWQSGAPTLVEPNFSTAQSQPRAVAIWQTYRKRWLSRYYQSRGMRVFVDLNVARTCEDLNLYGVPLGWKAYATRIHKGDRELELLHQAELAECHAGTDEILFVVYGHSKAVKAICQRQGWIYVDEDWRARDEAKAAHRTSLKSDDSQMKIEVFC